MNQHNTAIINQSRIKHFFIQEINRLKNRISKIKVLNN